jgi:hypothetical protein
MAIRTEAVGFLEGASFKGTFEIFYEFSCIGADRIRLPMPIRIPEHATINAEGDFDLKIR